MMDASLNFQSALIVFAVIKHFVSFSLSRLGFPAPAFLDRGDDQVREKKIEKPA
jgi:hypothetical protein